MPGRTERRDQRERRVERRIRHDVADLVQIGAEPALLTKFARQHAVDGVERHAHEEPYRDEEEHPTRVSTPSREAARPEPIRALRQSSPCSPSRRFEAEGRPGGEAGLESEASARRTSLGNCSQSKPLRHTSRFSPRKVRAAFSLNAMREAEGIRLSLTSFQEGRRIAKATSSGCPASSYSRAVVLGKM